MNHSVNEMKTCQALQQRSMTEPLSLLEIAWQFRLRLKRFIKRRFTFLLNMVFRREEAIPAAEDQTALKTSEPFAAGQLVRVRSREEIQATLDAWNHLRGCGFMEEMWQFCGSEQRVLKPVQRILDECDYRVRKVKGVVLLEGIQCQGTVDFGKCDRNCYFFWREEWLERK